MYDNLICHSNISKTIERGSNWLVLWILYFTFTAVAAFFIQLFVLPYIFPQAHLGNGLFVPDSTGFHQIAAKKAMEISLKGWSVWELKPEGQYPAGIASIFYTIWRPEPYVFIPFNAILHATSGCLIFFFIKQLIPNQTIAAIGGSFLFVINPSSFEWTAQIHRDGTFILGNFLILASWLLLLSSVSKISIKKVLFLTFLSFVGGLFIFISRPYWSSISIFINFILFAILFIFVFVDWIMKREVTPSRKNILTVGLILILIHLPFKSIHFVDNSDNMTKNRTAVHKEINPKELSSDPAYIQTDVNGNVIDILRWKDTPMIPEFVERILYSLWSYRHGTQATGGKTVIDVDRRLDSAVAFLRYLPRAFQVGFLSPFPTLWMESGNTPVTTFGRKILGIMTIFFYLCLLFFAWCTWENRKNQLFWIVVVFATLGLLFFTYAYANVGILSRMRYGFYMIIIGIGFAFAISKFFLEKNILFIQAS